VIASTQPDYTFPEGPPEMTNSISCATAIVKFLKNEGVTHVFGIPGGQILHLIEALRVSPDVKFISTRHEAGAAAMADAYARVTGRIGVCLATTGPGATNLLTAVGGAMRDSSPVLVLTGNNNSNDLGKDDAQAADHVAIFQSLTKWSKLVITPDQVLADLREAVCRAMSTCPGPVHLDFARDVLAAPSIPWNAESFSANRHYKNILPCNDLLLSAIDVLRKAERPVIWAGNGVKLSGSGELVLKLARLLSVPVITTYNGIDCVPGDDPNVFGPKSRHGTKLTTQIVEESDALLVVGNSLNGPTTRRWTMSLPKRLVQIDIDPLVIGREYECMVPLVGDAYATLEALIDLMEKDPWIAPESRDSWLVDLRQRKQALLAGIYTDDLLNAIPIKPQVVVKRIRECTPRDAILCFDAGNPGIWSNLIDMYVPRSYLKPVGFGNMGFALPAAIASKLARPDRCVVCVTGDGSLGMCVGELETAVRYGTDIKIVVMNDRAYGNIKQEQLYVFGDPRYFGVSFTDVKWAEVARGFGVPAERVETPDALVEVLNRTMDIDGPYLIDVIIDGEENVWFEPF
jgi:acetolactate synthase-1/2/3 large subunit